MAELSDINTDSGISPIQPDNAAPAASPSPSAGAEPKKLSLREQLQDSFKKASDPAPHQDAGTKAKATEIVDSGVRVRDEAGKFVKSDAAPEKAAPVKETVKQEAQPIAPKADGPPPGWSQESKALYNSLPDPLKADILKREKEVSDGFKKYSDNAKKYEEIEPTLSQARASFQQHGLTDAQAINRLFEWERSVRANPRMAIQALARQFGVDLNAQSPGPQAPDALQNALQPVVNQVSSLQSELGRIQSERAAQDIASFSKDKPYFERVKVEMGRLMQAGIAHDLENAYQRAIWNDPSIRDEMQTKLIEEKLSAEKQEQQQRAIAAKKAAVSPSNRSPSAPVANGKDNPKGVRGSILKAIETIREERA